MIIKTFPNITKRKGNINDNSRLNIITQRYYVTTQTAYNNKGALAMTDNIFQTLHESAGQDEILIRSLTDTERNPENFKYWLALADALVKRNMYDLASRCYDTRSRQEWYNKGHSLSIMSRHYEDQAIECYNKSVEIDPNFIEAWISKAMALSNSRNYKEAIRCANEGLQINSNNVYLQNIKCIVFARSGNDKKAIECYNKAIEIDPNFIEAWFNKGLSLDNLKKYKEAIECYDKAIEIDPDFIEAYFNKANALLYLKYYDQARECNKKAMDLKHAWDNWD
ncbi:MAG TPA: tetratricopeptide repeat protein [Nitrososphaeraceae archaeon]|nr:tetratricopeptide repeat protein [Nitrososphaeraceae archaeon]